MDGGGGYPWGTPKGLMTQGEGPYGPWPKPDGPGRRPDDPGRKPDGPGRGPGGPGGTFNLKDS